MSSLLPQALRDINSLRIQAGESTGVLNKMKINKTMMMKMKLFSFVVVIPGLPALRKRQPGVAVAADVPPGRAVVRRRRISIR